MIREGGIVGEHPPLYPPVGGVNARWGVLKNTGFSPFRGIKNDEQGIRMVWY
jgi:hypothetical protein